MSHQDESAGQGMEKGPNGPRGNPANLRSFVAGDGRAVAAGKRSGEVRRQRRAARASAQHAAAQRVATALRALTATLEGGPDIGQAAAAVAMDTLGRLALGEVPIRNAGEAAELLRVLVDVARLESGRPTSAALVLHAGAAGVDGLAALRARAREAIDATAAVAALPIANASGDEAATGADIGGELVEVVEVVAPPLGES